MNDGVTAESSPPPPTSAKPRARTGIVVIAIVAGVASLAVGGLLGTWQWDRAHRQAKPVEPEPRTQIADVMRPGEPGTGEGRLVSVDGSWAEADVAVVTGKSIEGADAVLLVRPFTVAADASGTGQAATLAVLSGWLPADASLPTTFDDAQAATLTGYVRGGEDAAAAPTNEPREGIVWEGSMSTASLANAWPSPVYSYLVVADEPAPGWNALPAPEGSTRLDFRSVTYAIEWWLFGAFGAYIAVRLVRDNGRTRPASEAS